MTDKLVYVVDDDADVRESMRALLTSAGFQVHAFDSAKSFLGTSLSQSGCVITDVRMPDIDGLELLNEMRKQRVTLPVIVVTGFGDIPLAVRAMKAGAFEFLEKPVDPTGIADCVERALASHGNVAQSARASREVADRLTQLTSREREVLVGVVSGKPNKMIAKDLSISPRTVEIHRAHLMEKMKAKNLADLVRMTLDHSEGDLRFGPH
jgi:two-component system response regulator FixJ